MKYKENFEHGEAGSFDLLEEADDQIDEEFVEPIAIIAFNGRFPGANDTETFWTNLRDGVESVKFFTDEELIASNIDLALLKNPHFVRADAVLDNIELFDAEFFNFSPREAEIMDPQHRLFLECAWEAVELAGYNIEAYKGRVGVFGGSGLSSYLIRNLLQNSVFVESVGSFQTMLGNSQDFLATKVSYKMNLMGPSLNTNTLCSSSSVSVHLACQSLWAYQTDMNLAGGVSIQVSRNEALFYQEGGIGAFDGHCRAFDERASGTVSGSGLGILILKRMEDALQDGDTIHALIRGSAVNNDGSVKLSYTAPSIDGQAEVIGEALSIGGINPESISYLECHGTGTSLGDPIEIAGLTRAFRAFTDRKAFCAVGSVKTNIGHLVTAGGVASLIKTVLALKHRLIPASLNFERPNPKIDFQNSPFFVNTQLRPWTSAEGGPLRAGVSSFGIGGTNAHQILEEAPPMVETVAARLYQLLPISARSEAALAKARSQLAEHLKKHPDVNFEDAAYTMRVGRKGFNHRAVLVCETSTEAIAALEDLTSPDVLSTFQVSHDRSVTFLISGQGSQYVGMAQGIYETEPVFKQNVDHCAEILAPSLGVDIREIMWPSHASEAASARLQRTIHTQPALFTIAYAQCRLLMSWGIQPEAMLGHSIGEYVAAHLAGVFSLEDVLGLVAERGRLIDSLPSGQMLAVSLAEMDVMGALDPGLSLAAVNGRNSCVVSGSCQDIQTYHQKLLARGVDARLLVTSHAFHSKLMEPILEEFKTKLSHLSLNAPRINFISNVTGSWITEEEATDSNYWAQHLRDTVRFHDGLGVLLEQSERVLVEVGPGRTLSNLAKQFPVQDKIPMVFHTIRNPGDKVSDVAFLHKCIGQLWLVGVKIDWEGYHHGQTRRRVPMPTYPFERRRYWIEPDRLGPNEPASRSDVRLLGIRKDNPADWFYFPIWKSTALPRVPKTLSAQNSWLLFSDSSEHSLVLRRRLVNEGQLVASVTTGLSYAKLSHNEYQLCPTERSGFEALIADLKQMNLLPQSIVYIFTTSTEQVIVPFLTTLYSCLALERFIREEALKLFLINRADPGVVGIDSDTHTALVKGLFTVIPHEMPSITCRTISVPEINLGGWRQERLETNLFAELTGDKTEEWVCYQGTKRWVRGFEPRPLDDLTRSGIRDGCTYIIIGGLVGTGLKLAEHLASKASLNLVLTSKLDFPDRTHWGHISDPAEMEILGSLRQIESNGSRVMTLQVDMDEPASLSRLLEHTANQFGTPRGLIFAEGPAGRDIIHPLNEIKPTALDFLTQIANALTHLEKALSDVPLDFCVLLSSIASELGGLGLGAYAAASAYCDSFVAKHNTREGTPWISFNWDGWLSAAERKTPMSALHNHLALSWKEGLESFDRVLDHQVFDQVALSTEDLPTRIRSLHQTLRARDQKAQIYTSVHERPNLLNPYIAPRNEVESKIAEIWQERLGIEAIGIHDNYFDLGGDSLLIVKIRHAIEEHFGYGFTSDLFEYPTVASIAANLDDQCKNTSCQENSSEGSTEVVLHDVNVDLMSEAEIDAMIKQFL